MRYKINQNQLLLDGFWFNSDDDDLLDIEGTQAIKLTRDTSEKSYMPYSIFKYEYRNLNKKIPFNGSIWLAKDFISSEYVHMGFQSPTAYRTVLKFDFEKGSIVNVEDLSKQVKKAWKKGDSKGYRPKSIAPKDVDDWIKKRFSLDPNLD